MIPGLVHPPMRAVLGVLLPLMLSACITEGPSPPRVDVPEPGAATRSGAVTSARPPTAHAYPSTRAYPSGSAARSYPATTPATASPGLPAEDTGGITVQSSTETPAADAYPASAESYPGAASTTEQGAAAPVAGAAAIAEDHVPARSSNNAVNALLASADGSRRRGDLDAAVAAAERALRIQPGDPAVYYELALLRLAQGQRELAGQLARKGLAQQPEPDLRQKLEELLAQATAASG